MLLLLSGIHPNPGPRMQQNNMKSLSIVHINARSIYPTNVTNRTFKLDEIFSVLCIQHKFDVICISETWLTQAISNDDINLVGYKLFRRDRGRLGGGVIMYVNDQLPSKLKTNLLKNDIESIWIETELSNKKIIIGTFYRPPNQTLNEIDNFLALFQESIDDTLLDKAESLIITGDFNDRCEKWDENHAQSDLSNKLVDILNASNLYQIIKEPTRITTNTSNLLDLIITDSPGYIMDSGTLPPLANLDHCAVFCKLTIRYINDTTYIRHVWDYKNANFQELNLALQVAPWDVGLQTFDDVNDSADYFSQLLLSTAKEYIPNRNILIRPKDKPWMTKELHKLFRIRNRLFSKFKRNNTPLNEQKYKEARRNAGIARDTAKLNFKIKLGNRLADPNLSSKDYWHTAKQIFKAKSHTGIPSLTDNNISYTTSGEKANLLNNFFASQQTIPSNIPVLPNLVLETNATLSTVIATENEILKILNSLDKKKATGPDGISNTLLKETATSIAKPLTNLANKSFETGKFPNCWKKANISPIYKKNNKEHKENYRPVSLLDNLGKILERIVFKRLYEYCKSNNLLTWRNSGFKELDSTINQLVFISNQIYKALEEGHDVCIVYLDVSKAFDKIWHDGLIFKLKQIGIKGALLEWIKDYLAGRQQRVVINGQFSEWCIIKAGVPQGSILGPLLFIIFVNNITNFIQSNIFLFADDTSLFRELHSPADITILNNDLQLLNNWSKQWLVTFNAKKTVYTIISRKKNKIDYPNIVLDGVIIQKVNTHCHLGISISSDFTWEEHIRNLSVKASKSLGMLWKLSNDLPRNCLENIYITCIRPIMEYGSQIFDNSPACHLKLLENVQRRAALLCTKALPATHHNVLLADLGWPTLSKRRKHQRLCLLFKIRNNLTQPYLRTICPPIVGDDSKYNLRNNNDIRIPKCRTVAYQNSFLPSTVHDWNDLNQNIRNSRSLDIFKNNLSNFLYSAKKNFYHSCSNGNGGKHLSRIRLGLSFLNRHQKDYKFSKNKACPFCNHASEDELHYFFDCLSFIAARQKLLQSVAAIISPGIHFSLLLPENKKGRLNLLDILLHGRSDLDKAQNLAIYRAVEGYILETARFT